MFLYIVISMYIHYRRSHFLYIVMSMYSNLHNMFSVDSVLSELAAARGWQVAGETVHIRKQEELIKPKKILAKIDMESEWQEMEEGRQLLPSDHPVV